VIRRIGSVAHTKKLNEVVEHYNYVVDGVSSEQAYPNGIRDQGRVGVTLDYFMNQKECKKAGLTREHVIALRLYTTVVYKYINAPLRDPSLYRNKRHPLAAVVYYIFQGIKMLRNCVDDKKGEVILWRGAKNIQARNDFLENGGTELAPMSTSRTLDVALRYLSGMTLDQGAVMFRVVVTNKLSMGADLSWLSAFPDEGEVLYPPMTFLEPEKQHQQDANGEGIKVTRQETIVRQNMSQGLQIIEMKPNLSASDGINIRSSVTSGKRKGKTGNPLSNELSSFLTSSRISVTTKLAAAFDALGLEEVADFDDLDEVMTASLESAMKPLEVKRFRKSISERNESAAVLGQAAKEKAKVPGGFKTHFFISHYQATGGDIAKSLHFELEMRGLSSWYDMNEKNLTEQGMEDGIKTSHCFILLLTFGVLTRPWVLKEFQLALQYKKPILLVYEGDDRLSSFWDFSQLFTWTDKKGRLGVRGKVYTPPAEFAVIFDNNKPVPDFCSPNFRDCIQLQRRKYLVDGMVELIRKRALETVSVIKWNILNCFFFNF
jgi:hypothetical protein